VPERDGDQSPLPFPGGLMLSLLLRGVNGDPMGVGPRHLKLLQRIGKISGKKQTLDAIFKPLLGV